MSRSNAMGEGVDQLGSTWGLDLVCFVGGGDRGAIVVLVGGAVATTHISPCRAMLRSG